jgi:hypothetical protein
MLPTVMCNNKHDIVYHRESIFNPNVWDRGCVPVATSEDGSIPTQMGSIEQ